MTRAIQHNMLRIMDNMTIDIKQRLRDTIDSDQASPMDIWSVRALCRDALTKIEVLEESIRTLQLELDIARSAVRGQSPDCLVLTRHTITLQRALPALNEGDSILLIVAPR